MCMYAYDEYIIIMTSLEDEYILIFTNVGHSSDSKSTGFGIRIVKHEHGGERVLIMLSDVLRGEFF